MGQKANVSHDTWIRRQNWNNSGSLKCINKADRGQECQGSARCP